MFGHGIPKISGPWLPVVAKLSLCDTTAEPVELHVYGFKALACDVVSNHSQCCCIVSLHWGGGLLVSLYFECVACRDGFPEVDE